MRFLSQYPREVKVFLAAGLINSIGSSLMWPLVAMFVFDHLGRSMADAGLVILIQSLGGIAGQLLGGALYHRIGVKRLLIGALGMNALCLFTLPILSQSWTLFMIMMGFIGLFNALSLPAIQAFIAFRFEKQREELFNVVYIANNIGVAIGTALSGFLAELSYSFSFIMNGVSSAAFAIFFFFYLKQTTETHNPRTPLKNYAAGGTTSPWILLKDIRIYLYMSLGILLLNLGNSIWNTGVSPFIISEGMSKQIYGFLWTLNGILIFIGQPFTNLVKRYTARSVSAQMTASSLFYLSGYTCILIMHSFTGMVIGMILTTFGEMLIAPAVPSFLAEYGGKNAPFYLGLSGGIGSAGRVVGPYVMGSLYDVGGLSPVAWLAVITAFVSYGFFLLNSYLSKKNQFYHHRKTDSQSTSAGTR